jgi:4-hydroxythreonine-4-phosphate dehydrogenase
MAGEISENDIRGDGEPPIIGITIGDAAGIGPEIVLKSLYNLDTDCRPVLIGDLAVLKGTSAALGLSHELVPFRDQAESNGIEVFDLANLPSGIIAGKETAETGKASAENIEAAVRLWREVRIDAIATAPISKKAISLAGYNFPGHTEFLAALTDTDRFAMSFFAGKLRVVLLTTHVSLRAAIEAVTGEALIELIRFTNAELARLLGRSVRLAVAGLNPHASEGGMFGDEETREIIPAVARCRNDFGVDVSGPFSPDTVFLRGFRGEFDGIIACYHDQATIAVKSLAFGSAVNVTLGLPLIRTSVDHGTAFDIAGQNIADAASMRAAIELAADLVRFRHRVERQTVRENLDAQHSK